MSCDGATIPSDLGGPSVLTCVLKRRGTFLAALEEDDTEGEAYVTGEGLDLALCTLQM